MPATHGLGNSGSPSRCLSRCSSGFGTRCIGPATGRLRASSATRSTTPSPRWKPPTDKCFHSGWLRSNAAVRARKPDQRQVLRHQLRTPSIGSFPSSVSRTAIAGKSVRCAFALIGTPRSQACVLLWLTCHSIGLNTISDRNARALAASAPVKGHTEQH